VLLLVFAGEGGGVGGVVTIVLSSVGLTQKHKHLSESERSNIEIPYILVLINLKINTFPWNTISINCYCVHFCVVLVKLYIFVRIMCINYISQCFVVEHIVN
jgi:hypothetical protein